LVAIRITLWIRESKVRNPDPPDRRRFVLSECFSCYMLLARQWCFGASRARRASLALAPTIVYDRTQHGC